MKILNYIKILCLLLPFNLIEVNSQVLTPLGEKCIAYWDFETGSSPEENRVSSNDATVLGATPTTGVNGNGYSFDGTDDVINLPTIPVGNSFSVSAWGKASATGLVSRRIVGRYFGQDAIGISSLQKWQCTFNADAITTSITPNTSWHHFVMTYDATLGSNNLKIYIDNTLAGQLSFSETEVNPTRPWQVGAHGNSLQFWSGLIDEVGFFDEALSTDEIATLYNTGTAPDFDTWYRSEVALVQNPNKVIVFKEFFTDTIVPVEVDFPYDPYEGLDVLYVDLSIADGGLGSSSNNGTSKATPITVNQVASMYSNFDIIAFSDAVHNISLLVSDFDGISSAHKKIGTYWKYGNDFATLTGYKQVIGTWVNTSGNIWTITDNGLPAGPLHSISNSGGFNSNSLATYGFLERSDGQSYAMSRYPNNNTFLNTTGASSANPATYLDDTETTFPNDYWNGAYINFMDVEWFLMRAVVADYTNSNGRYTFGTTTVGMGYILDNVAANNIPYFLTNHVNAMNTHGEWAYNPTTKVLSLYSTTNPNNYTWKFNTSDFLLEVASCDYLDIENIKFHGGVELALQIYQGSNVTVDGCEFYHAGISAIRTWSVDNLVVQNIRMDDCAGTGIGSINGNNEIYHNSKYFNIGNVFSMASDNNLYNAAISSNYQDGNVTVTNNRLDNTGYANISITASASPTPGAAYIERNYGTRACQVTGDGGNLYFGNASSASSEVYGLARNNYFAVSGSTEASLFSNGPMNNYGIYLDSYTNGFYVDSNVVRDTRSGVYSNGGRKKSINDNIIYNSGYLYPNFAGIRLVESAGGMQNHSMQRNIIISRDSTDTGFILTWDGTLTVSNTIINDNKYFHPFDERTTKVSKTYLTSPGTFTDRSLAFFQASPFFWEINSTFNTPDWTYQDVTGITRDQFVKIFFNWSPSNHTFSLGSATFKDPVTGSTVSGTITLPPYKGRALFYASGSLLGLDNLIYEP